jgi:ribose 1,5-bisphosphate isomerase
MTFSQIVKDITSLKIQGANAVAREACNAIRDIVQKSKAKDAHELYRELKKGQEILIKTRSTEPCMRNALTYILSQKESDLLYEYKEEVLKRIVQAIMHIKTANDVIAEYGAHKISNGMIVYTHCHSSTVVNILLEAKKQGIDFAVHNTETRPRFQGRKTAEELVKAGIKVRHFVDSAARLALKDADIMLIGCDAITIEGKIINKIGSELFAEVAKRYDIPVYSCTNSWKFDPMTIEGYPEPIETRDIKEIWEKPPKTRNLEIMNFAFEKVDSDNITGIISEIGIYPVPILVEELKKRNPWMFKKT